MLTNEPLNRFRNRQSSLSRFEQPFEFTLTSHEDQNLMHHVYHGGDVTTVHARFPNALLPWLDLSTGINALPYPIGTMDTEVWTKLPSRDSVNRLRTVAANAYGARDARQVVPAPGTQALIQLLPRICRAKNVAILGFGYQEHPATWRASGANVIIAEDLETISDLDIDVAVVVNPNNPDGRLISSAALLKLASSLQTRNGLLVVDEAFMDVVRPSASVIPMLARQNAVVLRSFGKAYGLAGLRLGFAIANRDLAGKMEAALGPWAVSGPAIAIGAKALADTNWLDETSARLAYDAARLDELLAQAGFRILGGSPLFRLVSHQDATEWFDKLCERGILVRPFFDRPTWLRFGIPGRAADWLRLKEALLE
ncbi:threonine-phosphate decarboxylase CobD [Bradyrhizobium genosp. P]|uniref:threonine-phosphate decarboxylase CobD n=1 Tax=Bradyrhizobium genosp. P TaxID=83641 RepID=UPI003CEE7027